MKHHTFFILLLAFAIGSCADENTSETPVASVEVPALLERPNIIGPAEEAGLLKERYETFKNLIQADPENHKARLDLAELLMAEARISGEHGHYYPAALSLTQQVLEQEPEPALKNRALCDQAAVLLSQHEFAQALELGQVALELNPYHATTYGILVDANVELGQYPQAVEMADRMIQTRPDLRSYSRISYLREIHGDVDGAIEAMKMAVASGYPGAENRGWARLALGKLYQQYGHRDSARMQFQMALQERPDYPFAIAALAELDALEGNMDSAIEQMERAANLIPEVGFHIKLATWAKEKGMTEKQEGLTRDILAMLKDDVQSGHQMDMEYAHLYLDLMEQPEKALKYALSEYEKRPANIFVNQLLAEIYYQMDEPQRARQHLDKAMATSIQDPEWLQLNQLLAGDLPGLKPTEAL